MDYSDVKELNFRDYMQAYNIKGVTNTNNTRTMRAFVLHLSINKQTGWRLESLMMKKMKTMDTWRSHSTI